jgi:hypothetical protein
MLAKTRTLLDESSAGFWSDTEIYSALKDGEYECLNFLASVYQAKLQAKPDSMPPDVLRALITIVVNLSFGSTGTSTVALPGDFFADLHVEYDDNSNAPIAAYRRGENPNRVFSQENTYLPSNQSQYYYWIDAANLNFGTAVSGTGAYRLTYLKKPLGISASQDAQIGYQAHEAICYYGFAQLLIKDQRMQEATQAFAQYMRILQNITY